VIITVCFFSVKFALEMFEGVMSYLYIENQQSTHKGNRTKRSTYAVPTDVLSDELYTVMKKVLDAGLDMGVKLFDCMHLGAEPIIRFTVAHAEYLGATFSRDLGKIFGNSKARGELMLWSNWLNRDLALRLMSADVGFYYADSAMAMSAEIMKIFSAKFAGIKFDMLGDEYAERMLTFGVGMLLQMPQGGFQGADYSAVLTTILGRLMCNSELQPTGANQFKGKRIKEFLIT
jgi:hypothetical protein